MFKLIATVLMISDTGSIATSMIATDIPNGQLCAALKKDFFTQDTIREFNGHNIQIKVKAECIPLGGPGFATEGVPPQITGMFRNFFNGMNVQ